MKKTALLLWFLTAIAAGQARLTISSDGHPVGYATVSQHLEEDGSKVVELRMQLTSGNRTVKVTSRSHYDVRGIPLQMYRDTSLSGGSGAHTQVVASFDAEGATAVTLEGDERKVKKVSLAPTAPRASLSEFWFMKEKPKVGAHEEAYQFNLDGLTWELATVEYRGPKDVTVAGRKVTTHVVVTKRGSKETLAYLDAEGLPILVEQGAIKMERIWPK